jgi:hypothetical protein
MLSLIYFLKIDFSEQFSSKVKTLDEYLYMTISFK